jgi:hypothetical protein
MGPFPFFPGLFLHTPREKPCFLLLSARPPAEAVGSQSYPKADKDDHDVVEKKHEDSAESRKQKADPAGAQPGYS